MTEPDVAGAGLRSRSLRALAPRRRLSPGTQGVLLKLGGGNVGGGQVPMSPRRWPARSRWCGGVQIAVVIGGGNFFPGRTAAAASV